MTTNLTLRLYNRVMARFNKKRALAHETRNSEARNPETALTIETPQAKLIRKSSFVNPK